MKNMFFFFIVLVRSISLHAGGNEHTESSNTPRISTLEQKALDSVSDLSALLMLWSQSTTELKNNPLTDEVLKKDQKIINDFLGLCRNSLQDVTTQLDSLDETMRTALLNSSYTDAYKKRLAELEIVSVWGQKNPHIVATLIAHISQKR